MDAEGLYREHRQRVLAVCVAMLGDPAAAEDAAQEVFLRVVPRLAGLSGDPRRYLCAVARNVCRDAISRRAARAAVGIEAAGELPDPAPAVAQQVADREALREALRGLPPVDRDLLGGAAAGLSLREMGERTGLAPLTVGQRISRARRRLRAELERAPAIVGMPLVVPLRRVARAAAGLASRLRHVETTLAPIVATVLVAQVIVPTSLPAQRQGPTVAAQPRAPAAGAPTRAGAQFDASQPPAGQRVIAATSGASAVAAKRSAAKPAAAATTPPQTSATVENLTPSPSYTQDQTVYASGAPLTGCAAGCPALLRSADGGRTWQRLAGSGFGGGRVFLSPHYPRVGALLSSGLGSLQRSDDGGLSFTTVVPGVTVLAADPVQDRLLLTLGEAPQLLVYDIVTGTASAGPSLPPGVHASSAGISTSGEMVVATETTNGYPATLFACSLTACTPLASIPADANPNYMQISPGFAGDATLVLPTNDSAGLVVSRDGGRTLQRLATRFDTMIGTVRLTARGTTTPGLDVVTMGWDERGVPGVLLHSDDGGQSFTESALHVSQVTMWLIEVVWLPDGRMLVPLTTVPAPSAPVACSDNGGDTWRAPC